MYLQVGYGKKIISLDFYVPQISSPLSFYRNIYAK